MADRETHATRCLHLVASSDGRAVRDCLAQCRPDDTLVFLDAGVLHLLTGEVEAGGGATPGCFYLAADLEAHGLLGSARNAGVAIATDADVCALLDRHPHCLTWT